MVMMAGGSSDWAPSVRDTGQRLRQEARWSMSKTHCPNCDIIIKEEKPREGDLIICPGCGVELEIVNTDPFEVELTDDWQNE
jgi:lysine biosynthesis protein LysW